MSRPITESRMASTTGFFNLPTNIIRPTTMSKTLTSKKRCYPSFFITDILADRSRSPSPIHKIRRISTNDREGDESGNENETILNESDDNGKYIVF